MSKCKCVSNVNAIKILEVMLWPFSYLVVGAEVEEPPRGVHEVGEMVEEA